MEAHPEDGAQRAFGQRFFGNAGVGYDFIGFRRPSNAASTKYAEKQAHKEKAMSNIFYFNWHDLLFTHRVGIRSRVEARPPGLKIVKDVNRGTELYQRIG